MKREQPFRLYLDTSVFGGCFDDEFAEDSLRVFDGFVTGRAVLVYSETVDAELRDAPVAVRTLLLSLSAEQKRLVPITWQAEQLADAYIKAGIVGEQWRGDCLHVAAATISHADAIVSWNFKHIVNLGKMKAYNEVNIREGYSMLTVLSPKEVNFDDTE